MRIRRDFAAYDVILDTGRNDDRGHGSVTLVVRAHLEPHELRPGTTQGVVRETDGSERQVVRWPDDEWRRFVSDFGPTIHNAWNEKLWLVRGGNRVCAPRGHDLFPPLRCVLSIRLVSAPEHAHATFRVYRVADDDEGYFNSSCHLGGRHSRWLPDARLSSGALDLVYKGEGVWQRPVAHEIGHYLGLRHVAEGRSQPYGETDFERRSLMGRGMDVRPAHAWPWTHRLQTLGFGEAWEVDTHPPRSNLGLLPPRRIGRGLF